MTVRARLQCTLNADNGGESRTVNFQPVYSSDPDSPNYSFSKATPSGFLSLTITNPDAFDQFEVGKVYDVDFAEFAG